MLSHGYPPTISGVTLVVQKLSRALAARGHQVLILTGSERLKSYRTQDGAVELLRVRSIQNPFWTEGPIPFSSLGVLKQVINDFRPDVIHTHENVVFSNQLLLMRDSDSTPRVSSCYFLPRYVTHYLKVGQQVENWIEKLTLKYALSQLNRFDHVIFSTNTQKEYFLRHGLKAPSTVISNGVDNLRYYPSVGREEAVGMCYRLPPHPRILCVGRLMKDKKIELLIWAMAEVVKEREAYLIVVGRGDERLRLERIIQELGMEKYIHLIGFVPEADLPAIYRAVDIFTIVSTVEVQSIPCLQAAVTGLPIVAVNAAALPELVRHGENGYLVPPDDPEAISKAILAVLSDPEKAARMGQSSLKIGQPHTNSATFDAYEYFYCSLFRSRGC